MQCILCYALNCGISLVFTPLFSVIILLSFWVFVLFQPTSLHAFIFHVCFCLTFCSSLTLRDNYCSCPGLLVDTYLHLVLESSLNLLTSLYKMGTKNSAKRQCFVSQKNSSVKLKLEYSLFAKR